MSMKQNASTAAKLAKSRAKVRKLRSAYRLMTSDRDNIAAKLNRERQNWECQLRATWQANQGQANIIRVLRNDLRHTRQDRDNLHIDFNQLHRDKANSEAMAQAVAADQAGTIQALRADLRQALGDYNRYHDRCYDVAQALGTLLGDLSELDSLYDIRERIQAAAIMARGPEEPTEPGGTPATVASALVQAAEQGKRSREKQARFKEVYGIRPNLQPEMLDLLEAAWGIIANAGPIEVGPPTATPGWSEAAQRFREGYHDLLGRLHPSPMVEPARTEEELEDELLDARAAKALAEYQERSGMTAEQVATLTAEGLLDAIDAPLADSTPEELAALAALAEMLAPLHRHEPMSTPAGMIEQDTKTGEVVSDSSAPYMTPQVPLTGASRTELVEVLPESRPLTEEVWVGEEEPVTLAYTPASDAAKAAMGHDGTTDAQAAQAAQEAEIKVVATNPLDALCTPPIELEEERYLALLDLVTEEWDFDAPTNGAADILRALGIHVPAAWVDPEVSYMPDPEPTDMDKLRSVLTAQTSWVDMVADVLAHYRGAGPARTLGDWFLDAASAIFPGRGTVGSHDRDHIWRLATELARESIQSDLEATTQLLARERQTLELVTERVATFAKDQDTYLRSLAALPTQ